MFHIYRLLVLILSLLCCIDSQLTDGYILLSSKEARKTHRRSENIIPSFSTNNLAKDINIEQADKVESIPHASYRRDKYGEKSWPKELAISALINSLDELFMALHLQV